MEDVKSLKDSGGYDTRGLKTGMWVEYKFDSAEIKDFVQHTDQGYSSYPLFDKVLIKSTGKYDGGSHIGKWHIYKSYSISKPFKWDLQEEIPYNEHNQVSGVYKYFRKDGGLIKLASYKDGLPDGAFKEFYPDGKPRVETPFKKGFITGTQKFYNDKGILIQSIECKQNYYNGKLRRFYSNGKLKSESIYTMGALISVTKSFDRYGNPLPMGSFANGTGTVIEYTETGAKEYEAEYKEGAQNGYVTEYYTDGNVFRHYKCRNWKIEGKQQTFYPNGKLSSEMEISEDGFYDGKCMFYYSNGKISDIQVRKQGMLWNILQSTDTAGKPLDAGNLKNGTGTARIYDDSCRITEISELKNGMKNGIARIYYPNGNISEEIPYTNDTLDGIHKKFYENGKILSETEVKKGKITGIKKNYYPNGKLSLEIYLVDDNCWNVVQQNDTNGNPISFGTLKDGTGILKIYDDSGLLAQDLPFLNGRYNGISRLYYPDGKLKAENTYVNDTLQGASTLYYENGKILETAFFHDGKLDGKVQTYHDNGKIWIEIEYVDGNFMNIKMNLDRDGHPQDKGTLLNGNGTLINYDEDGKPLLIRHFIHGELQSEEKLK
jgi:antitoxin component YwqK of YwqJK toxin-antitoxin module